MSLASPSGCAPSNRLDLNHESLGGTVVGLGFLIELEFLRGRAKLSKYDIHAVLKY